jgi:DNA polymerase elongation subunit (family B)
MRLSEHQKQEILKLRQTGYSSRAIAKAVLGRTSRKSTVTDFLKENVVDTPLQTAKILVLDIETSPMLSYHWQRWKQNIYQEQVVSESFVLTYACKWVGDDRVMYGNCTADEARTENDARIMKSLYDILEKADAVIAHNGIDFDFKVLNTRFLVHNLTPPKPYKQIDTLRILRNNFRFSSNKLNDICLMLGIEAKLDNGGFKTWKGYLDGDSECIKTMIDYNIKDTAILETLYMKLRAWDRSHPNLQIFTNLQVRSCPCCNSQQIKVEQNLIYQGISAYEHYRCLNCGKHFRDRKNVIDRKNICIGI